VAVKVKMSSKNDINRRVMAIQAKKKRKNPKGRGKPSDETKSSRAGGGPNPGVDSGPSNVALTSR